jgi:hypothetical protein
VLLTGVLARLSPEPHADVSSATVRLQPHSLG